MTIKNDKDAYNNHRCLLVPQHVQIYGRVHLRFVKSCHQKTFWEYDVHYMYIICCVQKEQDGRTNNIFMFKYKN